MPENKNHVQLQRSLGLYSALSLVIGTIIGSGIFFKQSSILANAHTTTMAIAAWVIGGIITLTSGLTIAEIGSLFPHTGGLYVYIEKNENPITAAKRELLEETGYEAKKLIPLASCYQDEGCMSAFNHIFLATGCKKVTSQKLDDSEYIKYMIVTYDEALELEEMGYIQGENSIIALEKSKKYIKRL